MQNITDISDTPSPPIILLICCIALLIIIGVARKYGFCVIPEEDVKLQSNKDTLIELQIRDQMDDLWSIKEDPIQTLCPVYTQTYMQPTYYQ